MIKLSSTTRGPWTSHDDDDLRRQMLAGRSINEIALRIKRTPLAVRTRIKLLGIKPVERTS